MIRSFLLSLSAGTLAFLTIAGSAQTPPNSTPAPPPTDPKELMLLAARSSNLTSEGAKPWHIKVSYTMYEEDGSTIKDQGLIEEFWASPDQSKLVTTGRDFTQTVFKTQDGTLRSGKQENLLALYHDAIAEMTEPIPSPEAINGTNFAVQDQVNGTAKLSCFLPSERNFGHAAYCLAGSPAIARIVIYDNATGLQAMRNRIQPYQDRFLAGDVIFRKQGKTLLTAHLESIEPLAPVDDALFTPPDDAVLLVLSSKTHVELIDRKNPEYPRIALSAHVQGLVLIQARIGKDGKPVDLKVITGPEMLRQASLDAVREFKYRPYLIHGKPVEFITNVPLNYTRYTRSAEDARQVPPPAGSCPLTGTNCSMQTSRSGDTIIITVPR